jgi:uncharacterized protein (DUF4213/DUF364 family)
MTCQHCNPDHPANTAERPATGIERQLIDDLLQAMDRPSAVISDIAVGSHFIGVRADDNGSACTGLASSLGAVPTEKERMMVAEMIGKPLREASQWLKTPGPFSIGIGAAALNAGIIPPRNQPDIEASRIMAEKGKHDETVLVGEFPFTDWLRQQVKTLYLFELQKVAGRTPPDQWDEILGRCKVLGLTGTTLITRAMATYLKKAPQAHTIIIGPTTPLSPVLFSHGADVLAGCQVVKPDAVFAGIREGMSFRELKKLGIQFIAWSKDSAVF